MAVKYYFFAFNRDTKNCLHADFENDSHRHSPPDRKEWKKFNNAILAHDRVEECFKLGERKMPKTCWSLSVKVFFVSLSLTALLRQQQQHWQRASEWTTIEK
jgi:hypothetical protein